MTLWGGRFADEPSPRSWSFTVDRSDERLLGDDIEGSLAHAGMLERVGLLEADEAATLLQGLRRIRDEVGRGEFDYRDTDEDIHSAVERRLGEIVGEVAGKLHTGRSRNDQVALDLRLYLRRAIGDRIAQVDALVATLAGRASEHASTVVPTYTHLQQAQSVSLGHHLLAYGWMLLRDVERLESCAGRVAVSPLGAGASAGSTLPLDPDLVARALGFDRVYENSLDAVASRDFAAEFTFACTQAMVHLSRLAEELVLWSTSEFGWVTFRDRDTTGSSALPHKKNPDVAELVRGRAAALIGDTTVLLGIQKGLPLAYNRDLQEDKRAVFHADDVLAGALEALRDMLEGASFHPPPPTPWVGSLTLAEALVRRGVPFREAQRQVGALVSHLVSAGRALDEATPEDLGALDTLITSGDLADLDGPPAPRVPGSGTPESVSAQVAAITGVLASRSVGD